MEKKYEKKQIPMEDHSLVFSGAADDVPAYGGRRHIPVPRED